MQLIKFELFPEGIMHGISTRKGGVSEGPYESLNLNLVGDDNEKIQENYRLFLCEVGVGKNIAVAYQKHTDRVLVVDKNSKLGLETPYDDIDGFITQEVGIPLVVRFADCQGVLIYDPVKRVIAAVHSGWRGNAQNIIGKTIDRMKKEFNCDPINILIGISQSLGPCCGDFTDPLNELPSEMHKHVNGKKVDLWACSKEQVLNCGIPETNLEILERCTLCENDKFFSFRADKGITGHMAAVIQMV
jgi:polyphenol oxidase